MTAKRLLFGVPERNRRARKLSPTFRLHLYSSLHIPSFPLSVLLRDSPEITAEPAALVNAETDPSSRTSSTRATPLLLAVNTAATRHRIAPGLTVTRALARCPQLILLAPDPSLERLHQNAFRKYVSSLGPDFEETAPGTFLLDLLSIPHALTSPLAWTEQALRKATRLRLPLHLAIAPTPDLALLVGRSRALRSTLTFHPEPVFNSVPHSVFSIQAIADLPLSSLQTDHGKLTTDPKLLQLWGIDTLGALATLPRQGLAERLGPGVTRLHDILHGKYHRLLNLHRPPQQFTITRELEHPLESLEPLLFVLRRGLDSLCSRLRSSQRAAISSKLTLTFADGNLHLRELRLPEPSCTPSTLLRLLHTHLNTVRAPAPVVAWSLLLTPTLPGEAQHHLFDRSLRDPHRFADTLARLEALLGPGRLGTPRSIDTHQPDSFQMEDTLCSRTSRIAPPPRGGPLPIFDHVSIQTALPLKRYRPALPVHVACESGARFPRPLALLTGPHRGSIAAVHGPFPLSGHWWNSPGRWQRVEWDLQLANQTLLRLTCQPPGDWLLEGIYE